MTNHEKLEILKYKYKYGAKNWNIKETNEFFDLSFVKFLNEEYDNIQNSVKDLLNYFNMSEIFSSYDINEIQNNLIKFLVIKNVSNVDKLLISIPKERKIKYFYELYNELNIIDNRPFNYYKIVNTMMDDEAIEFVDKTINQAKDEEILYLIQELYKDKKDNILKSFINEDRIIDLCTRRINAPFFYEICEDLNLSNGFLDTRKKYLRGIINNYDNYNENEIKEVFCDLYFHNTLNNVKLDLKTIIEFALDDKSFRNDYLGQVYNYLYEIFIFLNESPIKNSEILYQNKFVCSDLLDKCYELCQNRFKNLLSVRLNNNVINNIDFIELLSSNGEKVKCYKIENQTESQRNFDMLLSTIPISQDAKTFKSIYYSSKNGEIKYKRRSCSLVNEGRLNSLFGGSNRIIFGYDDLSGRKITSATLGDGRTDGNEERYRRKRRVNKSSYLTIDKFISGTQGHNEIAVNMGEADGIMEPSYILTIKAPTQFEIDVASEFNIPIRYVNVLCYEQKEDNKYYTEDYNYLKFQKNEIKPLIKNIVL